MCGDRLGADAVAACVPSPSPYPGGVGDRNSHTAHPHRGSGPFETQSTRTGRQPSTTWFQGLRLLHHFRSVLILHTQSSAAENVDREMGCERRVSSPALTGGTGTIFLLVMGPRGNTRNTSNVHIDREPQSFSPSNLSHKCGTWVPPRRETMVLRQK